LFSDQLSEFPLFSPIPWASAADPNERYPSPPGEVVSSAAATYPMANGVNGRPSRSHESSTDIPGSNESAQLASGPPPPIDAVDIGLVPEDLARVALEGGPPPRSPQELSITLDKDDENIAMDVE
jgi:hypothetical protein